MKQFNFLSKSLFSIIMLAIVVGAIAVPVAAAAPPAQAERDYTGLKYALKWLVLRADLQQDHLDHAQAGADLAAEFIAEEQAAGFDTSELEAALADFRASLTEAQGFHDTAAQILAEKAGFDSEGNVVDPRQARDTLKDAGRALQDSHQTLRIAGQDFRQAMRDYRQSKHNES